MTAIYADTSLVTVPFDLVTGGARDQSFDLAVIEFDDHGQFENCNQLPAAASWITSMRKRLKDGVVVVVFVHGWHHGARWEDTHFVDFRRVLRALAIREMERARSRRVIGIFVAWHGDPAGYWFRDTCWLTHLSFYNRYRTAKRISESDHLDKALQEITAQTKVSSTGVIPGQLIFVGHSMGGLIVESAVRRLIMSHDLLRIGSAAGPVITHMNGQPVGFPDAVLSVNSAADSRIWRMIGALLSDMSVSKSAKSPAVSYSPPLLVSVTSTADTATRIAWRLTKPWRRTTGHDQALLTHDFVAEAGTVDAKPHPRAPDFGQNYHVLRPPEPTHSKTPRMCLDLPVTDRKGIDDHPPHRRYQLNPRGPIDQPCRLWNFQLPPELVKDHNDIFNPRASSLLLALMQISGTVGSLAPDWESSFEPY